MDSSFHLADLHRLLFGEASAAFLLEACLRAALTYTGVVAVMRLLGARVVGQFTLLEMSVSIVVAAAIGVPLLSADRGLLPAITMVATLVVVQRVIANIGFRNRRFQTLVSSDFCVVVRDGTLDLASMSKNAVSRETIFSQVRMAGHFNLGEVARVYIEPSGAFTIVKGAKGRPGLSLIPRADHDMVFAMRISGTVCERCGAPADADRPCPHCGAQTPVPAVSVPEGVA
jgi:uncharacterized membrane protein YcaP (DUF421 family)